MRIWKQDKFWAGLSAVAVLAAFIHGETAVDASTQKSPHAVCAHWLTKAENRYLFADTSSIDWQIREYSAATAAANLYLACRKSME